MLETYRYTVHFEQVEDGIILATVSALRGCVTYGYTLDEAEKNIHEAIECYLQALRQIGEEAPIETPDLLPRTKSIQVTMVSP